MKKTILIVPAVVLGLTLLLSACNTFEGMGEDIKQGGEAITNTASDTKKKL